MRNNKVVRNLDWMSPDAATPFKGCNNGFILYYKAELLHVSYPGVIPLRNENQQRLSVFKTW